MKGDGLENRPFRFIASWQDHPQFQEFLRSTWDSNLDVESNIKVFVVHVRDWNVNVFEHIGKKKKELLARLRGIDRALCIYHLDFLVQLDLDLRAELAEVLRHEESLWLQKSRVQWATFRDPIRCIFTAVLFKGEV
ncbi:hypothetical protein V6N12_035489 [Hibiscus sabdariffa]|uniref:Uncharacterized protein n=1 Tax=Hibiscus sabdariffa TaxID=183260 RepID=A0ABR2ERS3_9ROSI